MESCADDQEQFKLVNSPAVIVFESETPNLKKSLQVKEDCESNLQNVKYKCCYKYKIYYNIIILL